MIITLWWRCWSWKSTVSKIIAQRLGYEIISIWNIKRAIAKEMGLTILEFDNIWWNNPEKAQEFDYKYEEYQKELDPSSNIILDSKMSFHCKPDCYNVFISVDDTEWARRIFEEKRETDARNSLDEVIDSNRKRHLWQQSTYLKLYDVDIFDYNHYNLVVDSTDLTPDQVAQTIIDGFNRFTQTN